MQFNPSTLRRLRNPVTGRLQRAVKGGAGLNCAYCYDLGLVTPAQLEVTFSDIILCNTSYCCSYSYWRYRFSWNYCINEIPIVLNQNNLNYCNWEGIVWNCLHVYQYDPHYPDCSHLYMEWDGSISIDALRMSANKMKVLATSGAGMGEKDTFLAEDIAVEDYENYCMRCTDVPNKYTSCPEVERDCWEKNWGHSGIVTIRER